MIIIGNSDIGLLNGNCSTTVAKFCTYLLRTLWMFKICMHLKVIGDVNYLKANWSRTLRWKTVSSAQGAAKHHLKGGWKTILRKKKAFVLFYFSYPSAFACSDRLGTMMARHLAWANAALLIYLDLQWQPSYPLITIWRESSIFPVLSTFFFKDS